MKKRILAILDGNDWVNASADFVETDNDITKEELEELQKTYWDKVKSGEILTEDYRFVDWLITLGTFREPDDSLIVIDLCH